ncbi:hypothetical protein HQ560_12740, partial [bacterium]|nr:hypothetical protein [bacterium]
MRGIVVALLVALTATACAGSSLADLTLRARVVELSPDTPVRILWRWGGEGLGGSVVRGELTAVPAKAPAAPETDDGLPDLLDDVPKDRILEETKAGTV